MMAVLWKLFLRIYPYASPTLTLLYPLYASVRAIESPEMDDDQQWLSYWIIYSFLTLFELGTKQILQWIPLWQIMKLVFAAWLVLPQFNGAAFAYEWLLRPYVLKLVSRSEGKLTDRQNEVLEKQSSPEAQMLAHRTVDDGKQESDKLISAEMMQASKAKPSTKKHVSFKKPAKLRKRTTRKVMEFFGVKNDST